MASARTLDAKNLEALGAERLAALLIHIAIGDAAIKRRLRLELAGEASPAEAARGIGKRLATIARARSLVEWHRIRPLAVDLATQHRAIVDIVAPRDPDAALEWPALDRAAVLVIARADAIDGNRYEVLSPAADALGEKYPLAATILHRAMIDFALGKSRTSRYGHAARHLADCARLAQRIEDYASCSDHDAYARQLRADHGRKVSFWNAADAR